MAGDTGAPRVGEHGQDVVRRGVETIESRIDLLLCRGPSAAVDLTWLGEVEARPTLDQQAA
jgi:hypothetical protein